MTYNQVMKELKQMGTAQNRKVYGRHGVGENMFGVSFANLNLLKKKIKVNHPLALELWGSGNHDARVLAAMIAEPFELKSDELDEWLKECDNYVITDMFASLASRTSFARKKSEIWIKSKQEWTARAGWLLLTRLAMTDASLSDEYFEERLSLVESDIHSSKNRVRDAMNTALINIGLRNRNLEKKAIATARKIGKVEVDHGQTECKTPDAIEYMKKTKEYRKKQKAIRAEKAKAARKKI
jgi:3-methyladenine DNA glycosylase AlkD